MRQNYRNSGVVGEISDKESDNIKVILQPWL